MLIARDASGIIPFGRCRRDFHALPFMAPAGPAPGRSRNCGIDLSVTCGEDGSRELTICPFSRRVRGSGLPASAVFVSDDGRPTGGGSRRRVPDARRWGRAGDRAAPAAAGPGGLDSDAHDTANAADSGCPKAMGANDARGGASVARLPVPGLDGIVDVFGVEWANGLAGGGRRSRTSAVAARPRDGFAAETPGR
jgi:hypothetical protein